MRATLASYFVLALAGIGSASAALAKRAACNADNCARAVTGTAAGLQSTHLADCSSFLLATTVLPVSTATVTVTPSPTTTVTTIVQTVDATAFVTITSTSWYVSRATSAEYMKRAATAGTDTGTFITPSAVPTYASACSGAVRYSSACACGGVKTSTTTVTPPATTKTVTAVPSPAYVQATETSTVATATTVDPAVATAERVGAPCNSIIKNGGACFQVQCNKYPDNSYPYGAYYPVSEYECAGIGASMPYAWPYYNLRASGGYCVMIRQESLNFINQEWVDFLQPVTCP